MQNFSTAVHIINYPMHKGQPNPSHGKFMLVGSVPFNCIDNGARAGRSKIFDTELEALFRATQGGATVLQRADCSMVDVATIQHEVDVFLELIVDEDQEEIDLYHAWDVAGDGTEETSRAAYYDDGERGGEDGCSSYRRI